MPFELLVGPPGSGKTHELLERARERVRRRGRVWWVGLPAQRAHLIRRATRAGAVLGLEFLTSQQLYYRLLAHALELKPLLSGTGRLALVGEALLEVRGELPTPGEARLFARAVAEAKRYALTPERVRGDGPEVARFRLAWAAYERVKGERWDYDDFRLAAVRLAEIEGGREGDVSGLEADMVVADGFREMGPLELRLLRALGRRGDVEVVAALPEAPPFETPTRALPARAAGAVRVHRAANPVEEARWALRSLKADLASGADPLDLAVVLPRGDAAAFAALADEYGVPLMDEAPRALADSLPGRTLLDLLELPDWPTPSRLLAIPELQPLARVALEAGVAGVEAIGELAAASGHGGLWRRWLRLLDVREGEEDAWARDLLEVALAGLRRDLAERDLAERDLLEPGGAGLERFREHALLRAQEAAGLARGRPFRAWWAALLKETSLPARPRGGVALLDATLASGRRFRRAYVMRAVEGAYGAGEGEDYFVPEEHRAALDEVFRRLRAGAPRGALPRRFLGRDRALFADLLARADEVVVTWPEADQGGQLVPEPGLVGGAAAPLPVVPAGSRLELPRGAPWRPGGGRLALGTPDLEALRRFDACAFRAWAERHALPREPDPWWREMLRTLREWRALNDARLEELRGRHPEAAVWLADRRGELQALSWGVRLPAPDDPRGRATGPVARLDAAGRSGREARLIRFLPPGSAATREDAERFVTARWTELWAAGWMQERYGARLERVAIVAWPVLGDPIEVFPRPPTGQVRLRRRRAEAAFARWETGDLTPSPGFVCRDCRAYDLCRRGRR